MGKLHDQQAQAYKAVKAAANKLLPALDDTQKTQGAGRIAGPGAGGFQGGVARRPADDGSRHGDDVRTDGRLRPIG